MHWPCRAQVIRKKFKQAMCGSEWAEDRLANVQLMALIWVTSSLYQVVSGTWCNPKIWFTIAGGMCVQIMAMRSTCNQLLNAKISQAIVAKRCAIALLILTTVACVLALTVTALGMNRVASYYT